MLLLSAGRREEEPGGGVSLEAGGAGWGAKEEAGHGRGNPGLSAGLIYYKTA